MIKQLPNFLIIGAQKGGSTWLYDTLKEHSEIFLPDTIELHHFNACRCHEDEMLSKYKEHFKSVSDQHKMVGEKTPSYFWTISNKRVSYNPKTGHNPNLVQDIKQQLGDDLKVLVSLRHPVKRAISAFFHHVKRGRINGNVSISQYYKEFGIIDMGFYSEHLSKWLEAYPKEQIMVLIMERDIIKYPEESLKKICEFLDVSTSIQIKPKEKSNVGLKIKWENGKISTGELGSPYILSQELKFMLDIFREDMDKLRLMLNDPLDEWKKIDQELLDFIVQSS